MKPKIILATLIASTLSLHAADWPQYRGAAGDGRTAEKIVKPWPATGPKVLWRVPATDGFSSFSVATGRAFTLVQRNIDGAPQETLLALDANTGKELWTAPLGSVKFDGGGNSGTPDNGGGCRRMRLCLERLYLAAWPEACLTSTTCSVRWMPRGTR